MSDPAELHGKILGFLMGEWARKDNRQLVSVTLLYSPGNGYRDEEIRRWARGDKPDPFAEFVNIEKLTAQIIEIAMDEADAKAAGKHRFIVRCTCSNSGRSTHSFALSPSCTGSDEGAIESMSGGCKGHLQVVINHAVQLMREVFREVLREELSSQGRNKKKAV